MNGILADGDAGKYFYPVSDMNGVTTALVAFVLTCVIFPKLVKNRPQFYAGFLSVVGIIVLHTLGLMILSLAPLCAAVGGLLQVGGLLLLFLAAGGLSLKDLAGEMSNAYEVIRRGGEKKEVIIPLTGAQPKPRQPRESATTERIVLDDPSTTDGGRIPLE